MSEDAVSSPEPETLPALRPAAAVATTREPHVIPALIAEAGEQAGWRYIEFFTANIRNSHTRRAYARACATFFAWAGERGLALDGIRPFYIAAWIEELQATHSAPGVKQQ